MSKRNPRIGTFSLATMALTRMVIVKDHDKFNNWGQRVFPDRAEAEAYAIWAHDFKEGRTFRDFA